MALPSIGLLGVGRMGLPIARALLGAGYRVVAHDPVEGRVALATGAEEARSAAEVAAGSDILVTVLPGAAEAELVMPGALAALPPGGLWLDLTSNDPELVERLAGDRPVVGAPMGGGITAAETSSLSFFVGGTDAAVGRVEPVLSVLGSVDHVGPSAGDGYAAKLIANLLWFGQAVAVTEALLLGQSLGIAPSRLRRSLASSAGGSVFIDEYLDRLLDGDYVETFGIDRCVEELEILVALARSHDVPFELSTLVTRTHRDALRRFGAVDGELLAAKLLEERAGRTLRRS